MASSKTKGKGAIDIIEEAIHQIFSAPFYLLFFYYTGTLPFVLGLLFFWTDMSKSALAETNLSIYATGMAVLFIWMKVWHGIYCQRLYYHISHKKPPEFKKMEQLSLIGIQTILHSTGLILLPLMFLILIPFPYFYALYQNISLIGMPNTEEINGSLGKVIKRSWFHAHLWSSQNIMIQLILFHFALFVFINLGITLVNVPYLLKLLFGIDTVFTLSYHSFLNTTFLFLVTALTYILIDPLLKAVYTLRCFYGISLSTGSDLLIDFANIKKNKGIQNILIIVIFLLPHTAMVYGERHPSNSLAPKHLENAIDETLNNPEFLWRMPRDKKKESEKNPSALQKALRWCVKKIKAFFRPFLSLLKKLGKWLDNLSYSPSQPNKKPSNTHWPTIIKWTLYALTAGLILMGIYFLYRIYSQHKKQKGEISKKKASPILNLETEDVSADAMPFDEWIALGESLKNEGKYRLSMRAFYLSTLCALSEKGVITLKKYKSNREYQREVLRKTEQQSACSLLFTSIVSQLDRAWYGLAPVTLENLMVFMDENQKVAAHDIQ